MIPFDLPLPGETIEDQKDRQNAMIAFIIDKHIWPRIRAVEFLHSLDERGLSGVRFEMKMHNRSLNQVDHDPFSGAFGA